MAVKKATTVSAAKPATTVADIVYTPTTMAAPTYSQPVNNVSYVQPNQVAQYVAPQAYQSAYADQLSGSLDKITNRQEFVYNPLEDASYKSLAKIYNKRGEQAAKNTLGDAAMLNGGYGSSYAVTAAQQARNDYNMEFAALVPQLEQNAYQRYKDNFDMNVSAYNALRSADESEYGRYRDKVGDAQWQYEQDYRKDRDKVSDAQWKYNADYSAYRDSVADAQWSYSTQYQQYRDSVQDANDAYNRQVAATQAEWDNYWNAKNYNLDAKSLNLQIQNSKKSSGSGSSGGSGTSGYTLEQLIADGNKKADEKKKGAKSATQPKNANLTGMWAPGKTYSPTLLTDNQKSIKKQIDEKIRKKNNVK